MYPLGALLNHSCRPNAVLYYCPDTRRQVPRPPMAASPSCSPWPPLAGEAAAGIRAVAVAADRRRRRRSAPPRLPCESQPRRTSQAVQVTAQAPGRPLRARRCECVAAALSPTRQPASAWHGSGALVPVAPAPMLRPLAWAGPDGGSRQSESCSLKKECVAWAGPAGGSRLRRLPRLASLRPARIRRSHLSPRLWRCMRLGWDEGREGWGELPPDAPAGSSKPVRGGQEHLRLASRSESPGATARRRDSDPARRDSISCSDYPSHSRG